MNGNSPNHYPEGTAIYKAEKAAEKAKSRKKTPKQSVKASAKAKAYTVSSKERKIMKNRRTWDKIRSDFEAWLLANGVKEEDLPKTLKEAKVLRRTILDIKKDRALSMLQAQLAGIIDPEVLVEITSIKEAKNLLQKHHKTDNAMNSRAAVKNTKIDMSDLLSALNEVENDEDELTKLFGRVALGGRRTRRLMRSHKRTHRR